MTRLRKLRHPALAILLAAGTLRCGEGPNQPSVAAAIELAAGNGQNGLVSQPLADPLVVLITDESGDPVEGVTVSWEAEGGGSVSAGTAVSGSDGRASVSRTLGPDTGEQTTTASVSGLEGSPITFLSIATDGTTPLLSMRTQPSSSAQSGVAFAVQPVVELLDPEGNPLPQSGLAVTATVTGGTVGGTAVQATDDNGVATFTDLNITAPAGVYTLRFTAPGTIQAVSDPITVGAGAGGIVITTNPPVAALTGEVFDPSVQPVVMVTDVSGNPAAGIAVTASTASGSGTLEGNSSATTDVAGVARFGDLGIAGTGSHTLEFAAGTASVTSSPVSISALPPEATSGEWGPLVSWDIVPLHMTLMPTGKLLVWGKTDGTGTGPDTLGVPRLWDPSAGSPTTAIRIPLDTMLFCAGHTLMPDGTLMAAGGHTRDDAGIAVTNFFSESGALTPGPNMAHARWYPTLTTLPDGRILTMAGRNSSGMVVRIPEIWEAGAWAELPGASPVEIPYYPRNFVAPDGRIFYAGERIRSRWFEVDASAAGGRGRWTDGPNHIWPNNREYGTAVMYEPGRILYAGGGGHSTWAQSPDPKANAPTATAESIDLNQSSPTWQSAGSMAFPRRHLNSTILPDGQVLITGGTRGGGFVNITQGLATREAEIWNPATGQWTTLASNSRMRVYHSVSLLLPNGTVLHGASGDAFAGAVPVPPERNHEIFSPPYLFKGARPTITSAPASVGYGQAFAVATPNAAQVTGVRWIRLGSVTHAFDMSQRANTLTFGATATGVNVTAPASPNLAPPGHYLLFILNRNGVPSEGKVVRVQ